MIKALYWRDKMPVAPRLLHENGMVLVELDGCAVVFPSETAARFFFESYTDVPNLAGEITTLRRWIDEAALTTAQARVCELEQTVAQLQQEQEQLQRRLASQAEATAKARQHARILAFALKHKAADD